MTALAREGVPLQPAAADLADSQLCMSRLGSWPCSPSAQLGDPVKRTAACSPGSGMARCIRATRLHMRVAAGRAPRA